MQLLYQEIVSTLSHQSVSIYNAIKKLIFHTNRDILFLQTVSRKTEVPITNVVPTLCISDCKVLIKVDACMEFAQKAMRAEHFVSIFESLFGCRKACYVMRKWDCWLLLKRGNLIFLFDPKGIEMPGKKKPYHRAVLYRLDNIPKAVTQLIECIQENSPNNDLSLEIGCVAASIIERKSEKSKKIKKPIHKKKCPN